MTLFQLRPMTAGDEAIPLYDFQREALDAIYKRRAEGITRPMIVIPTGGGKTLTAVHLIAEVGLPAVFICHREELVDQTRKKLREFDPGVSVATCKAEQGREVHELTGRHVVIASAQTLAHENRLRTLVSAVGTGGLTVVDECFPAGTAIDGKPIEQVAIGDTVRAFDHRRGRVTNGRVTRLYRRQPGGLVRVWFSSGRATVCTPEHPFFDAAYGGYRAARTLARGTMVLTATQEPRHAGTEVRHLPAMRSCETIGTGATVHPLPRRGEASRHQKTAGSCSVHGMRCHGGARTESRDRLPHEGEGVLFRSMHGLMGVATVFGANGQDKPPARFGANEGKQPHATARSEGCCCDEAATSGLAGIGRTWRERASHGATAITRRSPWLADGVRGDDWPREGGRAAQLVQVGHCRAVTADSHRSGRKLSQSDTTEGRGCPQDRVPGIDWVDRVEVLEPGSDGRFGGLCPDGHVYNFEVEGFHNYFANGVLVHNCHHSMAVSWERAIRALDPALLVGLTATPKRGDGQGLDALFQEIVYSVPMKKLVDRGLLARPVGIAIGTNVELDSVHSATGDFKKNELEIAVNTDARNNLVVDAYEKYASDRKRAVAFCVDRAHVRALTDAFLSRGHKAAYVLGDTPKDERQDIYARFSDGALNVLVNCEVLTEGWDEPKADCALMCRPTQSSSLYQQMAGRVLRKAEGKSNALILDFVDMTRKHELQTILTLAGAEGRELSPPKSGEVLDLFGDLGNVQQRKARVLAASERLGDLLGASPFVWQATERGTFVSCGNDQWLTIVPKGEGFIPLRVMAPRDGEPRYEVLFRRPVDADTAMNIAQNLVPMNKLTDRNAEWRSVDVPATEGQHRAARFFRVSVTGLTKGQASEVLDRAAFDRALRRSNAMEVSA